MPATMRESAVQGLPSLRPSRTPVSGSEESGDGTSGSEKGALRCTGPGRIPSVAAATARAIVERQ